MRREQNKKQLYAFLWRLITKENCANQSIELVSERWKNMGEKKGDKKTKVTKDHGQSDE